MEGYKGQGSILGLAKGWGKRYFAKLKIYLLNYHEKFFLNILCDFRSVYQSVLHFPITVQYPLMDFLTLLPLAVSAHVHVSLRYQQHSVVFQYHSSFVSHILWRIISRRPLWDHCQNVTSGVAFFFYWISRVCLKSRRWGYRRIAQSVTKPTYT
jgi:hypothetical protein